MPLKNWPAKPSNFKFAQLALVGILFFVAVAVFFQNCSSESLPEPTEQTPTNTTDTRTTDTTTTTVVTTDRVAVGVSFTDSSTKTTYSCSVPCALSATPDQLLNINWTLNGNETIESLKIHTKALTATVWDPEVSIGQARTGTLSLTVPKVDGQSYIEAKIAGKTETLKSPEITITVPTNGQVLNPSISVTITASTGSQSSTKEAPAALDADTNSTVAANWKLTNPNSAKNLSQLQLVFRTSGQSSWTLNPLDKNSTSLNFSMPNISVEGFIQADFTDNSYVQSPVITLTSKATTVTPATNTQAVSLDVKVKVSGFIDGGPNAAQSTATCDPDYKVLAGGFEIDPTLRKITGIKNTTLDFFPWSPEYPGVIDTDSFETINRPSLDQEAWIAGVVNEKFRTYAVCGRLMVGNTPKQLDIKKTWIEKSDPDTNMVWVHSKTLSCDTGYTMLSGGHQLDKSPLEKPNSGIYSYRYMLENRPAADNKWFLKSNDFSFTSVSVCAKLPTGIGGTLNVVDNQSATEQPQSTTADDNTVQKLNSGIMISGGFQRGTVTVDSDIFILTLGTFPHPYNNLNDPANLKWKAGLNGARFKVYGRSLIYTP